jgi:predicted O-methyltransferase YrrM
MSRLVRHCKRLYFSYFSQPSSDRFVYRFLRKRRIRKILELGIGTGVRAQRMLQLATGDQYPPSISYTGVDLFESRSETDGPGLSLKLAHRQLKVAGARVRLVPGDPYSALARIANELGAIDLILISADQDRQSLAKAWFYVPRIMHAETLVLLEDRHATAGVMKLSRVPRLQIEQWAAQTTPRRAAA